MSQLCLTTDSRQRRMFWQWGGGGRGERNACRRRPAVPSVHPRLVYYLEMRANVSSESFFSSTQGGKRGLVATDLMTGWKRIKIVGQTLNIYFLISEWINNLLGMATIIQYDVVVMLWVSKFLNVPPPHMSFSQESMFDSDNSENIFTRTQRNS